MTRSALTRWIATGFVLLLAATMVLWKYRDYLLNPWTRDGLVNSRVVLLAPQVGGAISRVHVAENAQVRQGDPLSSQTVQDAKLRAKAAQATVQATQAALELDRQQLSGSSTLTVDLGSGLCSGSPRELPS